jgi:tRNA G18 (ribose-2'-O)-methylase SpoU
MDTFGFTKKKLMALPEKRRHHHIIKWLSAFYQAVTTNRLNSRSYDIFTAQYHQVLTWLGRGPFSRPEKDSPRLWLETLSDRIHQHRRAMGMVCRDFDLLKKVSIQDVKKKACVLNVNCCVALDGLRSLFNTGAIIRTCEAAGFTSVIIGNGPDSDHPGIRKTAMGADQWIHLESTRDLGQALLNKKAEGYKIIGVETMEGSLSYDRMNWQDQTILVFGNEEYGISSHVMGICDHFVHIPMFGKKNSINVSNAVSVVCFHVTQTLARSMFPAKI